MMRFSWSVTICSQGIERELRYPPRLNSAAFYLYGVLYRCLLLHSDFATLPSSGDVVQIFTSKLSHSPNNLWIYEFFPEGQRRCLVHTYTQSFIRLFGMWTGAWVFALISQPCHLVQISFKPSFKLILSAIIHEVGKMLWSLTISLQSVAEVFSTYRHPSFSISR